MKNDTTAAETMAALEFGNHWLETLREEHLAGLELMVGRMLLDAFHAGAKWQRDNPDKKPVS